MIGKLLGKQRVDLCDLLAIDGACVAVIVSATGEVTATVACDAANLLVLVTHPVGLRRTGGSEHGIHTCLIELVDKFDQPVEVIYTLFGFQLRPAEHRHRDTINVGFLHQFDVLGQDLRIVEPLVRVIVRTMHQTNTIGDESHKYINSFGYSLISYFI